MPELLACLAALTIALTIGGLLVWARRRGDAAVARELEAKAEAARADVVRTVVVELAADPSGFNLALARCELAAVRMRLRMRRFGRALDDVALHTGSVRVWQPDEHDDEARP